MKNKLNIKKDEEWATIHLLEGESWIESYWKSRNHPHRFLLLDRMSKFSPISSVLEIGCGCGPNLYQLAKKFPDAEIRGIDINPIAVQKGNEFFNEEGITNVKLEVGKAQELSKFSDESFDVVLTDAVLIYIDPNEIKNVIKEMFRISGLLILYEWHSFNNWLALLLSKYYCFKLKYESHLFSGERVNLLKCLFEPRSVSLGLCVGHWVRDYKILLGEFVPKEKIRISRLPKELSYDDKNWRRWGVIVEVDNR